MKVQKSLYHAIWSVGAALLMSACSTAERNFHHARQAWSIGAYATAADYYKKAYRLTPGRERQQRGRLAFLMGECYRRYGYSSRALGSYRNAERFLPNDTLTQLRIGEMELLQGNYRNAERAFHTYLNLLPDDAAAQRGWNNSQRAVERKQQGSLYTVKMATAFNSNRSDFSPALFGEEKGQILIFTSNRNSAVGDKHSDITGEKNNDLFQVRRDEKGRWKAPEPLSESINTADDEGTPCLSPDGKTLYFTRCTTHPEYPRMAEIWSSGRSEAAWSKPQVVKITNDSLSNYAHPAVSPDGRWLYFSSDMPGGMGGYDLWRADLREGRGVGSIENLGSELNTAGNEQFPTFHPDGTLYFSSDGRESLGGLDLFRAHLDTILNTWSVEPLPAPMNSNGDDFGITFEGWHQRGYFSSSRATNGRGWDKLYEFAYPEVLQTVKGWVYEQDGYELPDAQIQIVGNDGTNLKIPVKPDGSFELALKPGTDYLFLASCPGFLNFPNHLLVDRASDKEEQHVLQFPLASLTIPVLVRNVFYAFDSADITPESSAALDRLAQLLTDNGHITIELAAHTDQRGSEAYNLALSQRRAESVVRYLTQKGIAPDRLTAKGYGKRSPKVVNRKLTETHPFLHEGDTLTSAFIDALPPERQDSCHALNRRTEFRVLRTTYGLFDREGRLLRPGTPAKPSALSPTSEDDSELLYDPQP